MEECGVFHGIIRVWCCVILLRDLTRRYNVGSSGSKIKDGSAAAVGVAAAAMSALESLV